MDAAVIEAMRPILIVATACLVPILLLFTRSYFKHKEAELELERELRKHEITHGAGAMEMRLRALESAVQSLASMSPHLQAPAPRDPAGPGLPSGERNALPPHKLPNS